MSGSVRDYAVLYLAPRKAGALTSGGGNALLTAGPHGLDGPEHVQKDNLHSAWTLVAGGSIAPTAGDPPTGEVVVQVKTTAGAPTHTATRGTPCWVAPDEALYVNSDGATTWAVAGGGNFVTVNDGGKEMVNTVDAAGATETLDLADGNVHDVTLDADCVLTFAGATADVACSFTLLLRQDGTGGWTTTWPGSVIWAGGTAPTLDETASTAAVLTFFTLDGGTVWYGFPTGGGGVTIDAATTITDETTWGIAPAVGSDTEYARQDHTHGTPSEPAAGGVGPLLIEDTPAGSPLVFADLLQNEEGTDLLYADAV